MILQTVVLTALISCLGAASTAASTKSELLAAGMSEAGAIGIADFDDKFEVPRQQQKTDPEGSRILVDQLHQQFLEYIKTLSPKDQDIYWKYINQKNAQPAGGSIQ